MKTRTSGIICLLIMVVCLMAIANYARGDEGVAGSRDSPYIL